MRDEVLAFGPRNRGEEEIFAIEKLVFSVQLEIQKAMARTAIDQRQLAERLGCSPARVSQYLASSGANLTLKTIARIFHALGEDVPLAVVGGASVMPAVPSMTPEGDILAAAAVARSGREWRSTHQNDNLPPFPVAA